MAAAGQKKVLIAAGGTGGHLFPAQALADELVARGWRVELATDHRVETYGNEFPASETHILPSATLSGGGILGKVRALLQLASGFFQSFGLLRRVQPDVVVGFGGYPTVPPLLAATFVRKPTLVHEANAVLGRANKFLAPRVTYIATSAPGLRLSAAEQAKATETGNPVRPAVLAAAKTPYPVRTVDERFHLLVFGGSQGARVFSDVMPEALENLSAADRGRLHLVQQCRPEDLVAVKTAIDGLGIFAEVEAFFKDLPERIAHSHLIVCRSGASTVAELGAIGRPALLVPLPGAIDQDQSANAKSMEAIGGATLIEQKKLSAEHLAGEIASAIARPERLAEMAANAAKFGRPDAAKRLADLVEKAAA